MSVLPEHPGLDAGADRGGPRRPHQARRQAKDLLRAAQGADAGALARLAAVSAPLMFAGAQLALARGLGQAGWAARVREIQTRNASMPENVARFLRCSVNLQIGSAARMLHENPALADSGFPSRHRRVVAIVKADVRRPDTRRAFATPAALPSGVAD